jgi:hypothetical protein
MHFPFTAIREGADVWKYTVPRNFAPQTQSFVFERVDFFLVEEDFFLPDFFVSDMVWGSVVVCCIVFKIC